ncbi:MAG TPA: succinylglutamate desuccinylase/aspartoacylase family protein [Burkholderiales bacterium]
MPQTPPTSLRIHRHAGLAPGPKLIVLGAVHGNEVCGTEAIMRILGELDAGALPITRGAVTFVPIVNPLAYQLKRRQGDRNLNRNLEPKASPQDFEDRIASVLCPLLAEHDVLLDLHSFHTAGQPFAMIGPHDNAGSLEAFAHEKAESRLVAHLGPRRVVEGWMDTYQRGVQRRRASGKAYAENLLDARYGVGTTEYMRTRGGYGVTLECGQHEDPNAPEVAYRAIRQTLALLELAPIPLEPARADFDVLRLADVIDRDSDGDVFARAWASFDAVKSGETIGTRKDGAVIRAPSDGHIVFPNPNALPGAEWFYFAEKSARVPG